MSSQALSDRRRSCRRSGARYDRVLRTARCSCGCGSLVAQVRLPRNARVWYTRTMSFFFGHHSVLEAYPSLNFDLGELPPEIVREGSIDQIAIELERMSSGSALAIRTNTLHALGERMWKTYAYPVDAIEWLATGSPWLGLWAMCSVGRYLALEHVIEANKAGCVAAIEAVEGMMHGTTLVSEVEARTRDVAVSVLAISSPYVSVVSEFAISKIARAATMDLSLSKADIRKRLVEAMQDARGVFPPMYEKNYARDLVLMMAKSLPGAPTERLV